MVFKRYASPFSCIDQFIELGQFSGLVQMLYAKENEEKLWQFFLHKVDGKSFEDFKAEVQPVRVKPVDTKTVIEHSLQILKGVSGSDKRI